MYTTPHISVSLEGRVWWVNVHQLLSKHIISGSGTQLYATNEISLNMTTSYLVIFYIFLNANIATPQHWLGYNKCNWMILYTLWQTPLSSWIYISLDSGCLCCFSSRSALHAGPWADCLVIYVAKQSKQVGGYTPVKNIIHNLATQNVFFLRAYCWSVKYWLINLNHQYFYLI